MKRLVILTGAGMSSESGIRTFRDSGPQNASLWLIDPMDVIVPVNRRVNVIKEKAAVGVAVLSKRLLE